MNTQQSSGFPQVCCSQQPMRSVTIKFHCGSMTSIHHLGLPEDINTLALSKRMAPQPPWSLYVFLQACLSKALF